MPVTGDLATGTAYLSRSVIINPTPHPITLTVLAQIPAGAIPIADARATHGATVALGAYGNASIEQPFYFPAAGRFGQFPTHCQSGDAIIAAEAPTLRTVIEESAGGTVAWHQRATDADLLKHIATAPRADLDLAPLLKRLGDRAFFE